jgi:hypothetical protein
MSASRRVTVIAVTEAALDYERVETPAREFDLALGCDNCKRGHRGMHVQLAVWHDGKHLRIAIRSEDERRDDAPYHEVVQQGPLTIRVED